MKSIPFPSAMETASPLARPRLRERLRDPFHLLPQLPVAQTRTVGKRNRWAFRRVAFENIRESFQDRPLLAVCMRHR